MKVNLKINPEFEALLPKLSTEQYDALKKSVMEEGQHYPIAYNADMEILDGHHRFKICNELGIEPKLEEKPRFFKDKRDERQFILETNLIRRHLETWYRIMTAKPLLLIYREKANERRKAGMSIEAQDSLNLSQKIGEGLANVKTEEGKSVEQFAQAIHSNPETVRQALYIDEHAPLKIKEKLKENSLTISAAYAQTKATENLETIKATVAKPLPEGKYRCIVIDPPWAMQKIQREVRPNQTEDLDYPTMTLEEIAKLPIKEKADSEGCHVYLWTTHRFLPDALDLFQKWGVNYECLLTWVKNVGFTPFSWMYNTEHVLFGRIGSLKLLKLGQKLSFEASVTRHSEKPYVFFDLVRSASPEPRLEIFQRRKHDGFEGWGNETGQEL